MDDNPATLDKDMKLTCDAGSPSVDGPASREKAMRFTYPSGSRPLEGYTIKRGIGIGGFGEVYFALNDAGKEVALKKIQRNLDIELRGVRQCLNLKHVNLIKLWDIRTCDIGESWVVMEYVPGESLREVIERNPQGMPDDQMRHWFDSTCAGVTYLHERGIVHRDLKPGNIFRDDDENVIKIGDYGLSKFISCSNRDGQTETVGTFHYMAPEIGKGVYGKEIDVYALGIILFEMLTGRVPYEGESSQEIIMKHLTAVPDVRGLRAPYSSVIERALAKDPQRRFHSAPEMLAALNKKHAPAATQSNPVSSSKQVPPIQPMFIGEAPTKFDSGILFGDVCEVVDAVVSHHPSVRLQPAAVPIDSKPLSGKSVPDEPIARAVHGSWNQTMDWWNRSNLNTPVKVLLVAGVATLLLVNMAWLFPVSLGLGLLYLIYFTIRNLIVSGDQPDTPRPMTRIERREQLRTALAARPAEDRTTELVGSLVVSGLVCLVLGFFALLASPTEGTDSIQRGAWYAWTVVTAISGSWVLLLTCKTWEHREGEALLRRFTMATLGVVTGLVAWSTSQFLHLQWQESPIVSDPVLSPFPQTMFNDGNAPNLLGCVLFFAGLFLILRWWRQADPVRRSRMSIWSAGLCLVWATVIGQFFYFPLPWSCIIAVMLSVATQFAAPWLTHQQRLQLVSVARK